MCGPLACALMPSKAGDSDPQVVRTVYHASRLAAYAVLGAVAGGLGSQPLAFVSHSALRWLPWILVFFFLGLAFRWDRWMPKPAGLGRLTLWMRGRLNGRSRTGAACALGLATPLLPCGPLYFLLALALVSGSALRGTEFMLAFGLGTVPLLWLAQSRFQWLRERLSPLWLGRARIALALSAAMVISWRLRASFGLAGPDPATFCCF
jgi:sulfite exporter TauE/SafE